jgi:diaminopimelate decarboxylase
MHQKKINKTVVNAIMQALKNYPTPFYIYDAHGISQNVAKFLQAFSWNKGFKEFFAVKALPNPHILKHLQNQGLGVDCSSLAELVLAQKCGFTGHNIMFTSNNTQLEEYKLALELGAIINLDDITHIDFLANNLYLPELICFRYNPQEFKFANSIIGDSKESKFGLTLEQLLLAYKKTKKLGVKYFALHVMVASNELNPNCFIETAKMAFELAIQIKQELGINLQFINLGGGLGIPYLPEEKPLNIIEVANEIKQVYLDKFGTDDSINISMENGRYITGPYGFLVTKAIHTKSTYKEYIGVDASMADLMRPGMYGAYHHITVLGKESQIHTHTYDIIGSLCENNDKFAINRQLPKIDTGDILVIHDTGAHAHAMGFNYNGKLRPAELLLTEDNEIKLIRRSETLDDHFATLDFSILCHFHAGGNP